MDCNTLTGCINGICRISTTLRLSPRQNSPRTPIVGVFVTLIQFAYVRNGIIHEGLRSIPTLLALPFCITSSITSCLRIAAGAAGCPGQSVQKFLNLSLSVFAKGQHGHDRLGLWPGSYRLNFSVCLEYFRGFFSPSRHHTGTPCFAPSAYRCFPRSSRYRPLRLRT